MATAPAFYLELDRTGLSSANLVSNEPHTLANTTSTRIILPKYDAFYSESLRVYSVDPDTQATTLLTKDIHYIATEMLHKVTKVVGKSVCTVILVLPSVAADNFLISYQALGGHDRVNSELLQNSIDALLSTQAQVNWADIQNKPKEFPPAPHLQDALDLYGLEYVTDSLADIKYAVNTGDEAIHRTLIDYWNTEQQGFFNKYNNDICDRVDVITTLNKSAEDTLKVLSVTLNEIIDRYEILPPKIAELNERILDYKHLDGNDRQANVANLLCKREYDENGTLIDVPALLDGLYLYLDSANYNTSNSTWVDKRGTGVGFLSNGGYEPSYGPSYTRPGINAVKFTTGKWMYKNANFGMTLVKGRTVIAVMGHRNGSKEVKMPILSGATRKLEVDVQNEVAAKYSNLDGTNVSYLAKTSKHLKNDPFVDVINLGSRNQDCICLNNTPYSYYKTPDNIQADQLHLDGIGEDLVYLGHPSLVQDAEVFMLLIYQRELSKVEMHAVLTYIRLKYGSNVNYLTNPSFDEGATNMGSGMYNYLDFTQRDCIKVTDDRIAFLDTQNTYSDPLYPDPLDIRLDDGKYLFVYSQSPNLNFWNQEVKLEPNTRYEFKYSLVYGSVNPPVIRLKINGVWHSKALTLDLSKAIKRDITYTFVTTQEINKLELFNLNTATVGNSFGIDSMSLVRMIYAVSN